jgi:F-type H+-transporting ATPase subunit b
MAALLLLQEGGHGAGGPGGPFALEPGLIIWTWLIFGVLLFLLWKFALPPIVRLTEERERKIKAELEQAEKRNAEAQALLEEHRKLLAGAREQAHALLNEAKLVAQKEREDLLAKARREQEEMLERARREIQAERERAIAELRREAVELSLAAASRLIEAKLDDQTNRRLVEEFLASLEKQR